MVTLQKPAKNGALLIHYILDGKGHDGSEHRCLCVETLNLMPADTNGYISQFKHEWSRASSRHTTQCRHLIFSPSDMEIPYDTMNAQSFADLVKAYISEQFPHRRAILAIQNDNEASILHCHVALSDCDIYNYKSVEKEKQSFYFLKNTFNEYFTRVTGKEIDKGQNRKKREHLHNKLVVEGQRDDENKYLSYIDDIKDRIAKCITVSKSLDEYWDNLKNFGLTVVHHTRKKSGDTYETYELHDFSNISKSSKDKNGNLKKLARNKNQLPSVRSYKHAGISAEDIQRKIQEHIKELDLEEEIIDEASPDDISEPQEELMPVPSPYESDVVFDDEYNIDDDDERQMEFTYKRYQRARDALDLDSIEREAIKQKQRQKQKSL